MITWKLRILVTWLSLFLKSLEKRIFHWTIEADNTLKKLKTRMSSCPFISYSDPSLPYVLVTDASDVALGAILMQKKGSNYRVIATVSKCFSATERRWSATERECYAVLYSCRKLEYFLGGVHLRSIWTIKVLFIETDGISTTVKSVAVNENWAYSASL